MASPLSFDWVGGGRTLLDRAGRRNMNSAQCEAPRIISPVDIGAMSRFAASSRVLSREQKRCRRTWGRPRDPLEENILRIHKLLALTGAALAFAVVVPQSTQADESRTL